MLTPRFQRVSGSSWPVSTEPKKSKRALSNDWLRYGAAAVTYRETSHACHVPRGTRGTIAAKALKKDGCARITAGDRSMPCGFAHAAQSDPGISVASWRSVNRE